MKRIKSHTQLKAFTIIELLTVMAVSAIVMTAGVMLFKTIDTTFISTIKDQDKEYQINKLYVELQQRFFSSDSIILVDENEINIHQKEHINQLAFFSDELTYSKDLINVSNLNSEVKTFTKTNKKVNQVLLSFDYSGSSFKWNLSKDYGISQIIYK